MCRWTERWAITTEVGVSKRTGALYSPQRIDHVSTCRLREREDCDMDNHDDELVAVLKHLGDVLLQRSAGDDLKALLAGDAKLVIVRADWRVVPPATPRSTPAKPARLPRVEIPAASRVRMQILEAPSTDARRTLLQGLGMNQTQARRLATDLGVKSAGRSTIDQAIEKILEYYSEAGADADDSQRY
jgi:hypothetical protein